MRLAKRFRFKVGTRVKLKKQEAEKFGLFTRKAILDRYDRGTVVGVSQMHDLCVYVKWDHRKARELVHINFLERVREGER